MPFRAIFACFLLGVSLSFCVTLFDAAPVLFVASNALVRRDCILIWYHFCCFSQFLLDKVDYCSVFERFCVVYCSLFFSIHLIDTCTRVEKSTHQTNLSTSRGCADYWDRILIIRRRRIGAIFQKLFDDCFLLKVNCCNEWSWSCRQTTKLPT